MSHSNSSLNCFTDCMAKYEHRYILKTPSCRALSPHLEFGTMAHEVLAKAGQLRDEASDGVVTAGDYKTIIPSEVLYPNLKTEFAIRSWERYFTSVIKQTAAYEKELIYGMVSLGNGCKVQREVRVQLTTNELKQLGRAGVTQAFVGVIDLLIMSDRDAIIMDYKFSTNVKTQDDFDLDSQLQIYAYLVSKTYGIAPRNIQVGYIDIPKKSFDEPVVLKNGTLSRAKSQNCSQEMYGKAVKAIHGDDDEYNCEPGGYYHDIWCELALNKPAYMSKQYLDLDVFNNVVNDVFNTAKLIDFIRNSEGPFLKKYDSYSCKSCEYLRDCKPWLFIDNNKLFKEPD